MHRESPLVSVIMLAYNSERYMVEAIETILNQTYQHFEFLIITEPSNSDATPAILEKYSQQDSRIRVIVQSVPGVTAKRESAWPLAKGKYVAWADADDVYCPQRLEKQVVFLESHLEIGICGTWVETIGATKSIWKYPTDDGSIRSKLLFSSTLANPTVMMRLELFSKDGLHYDLTYLFREDYDLWTRAAQQTHFANIPEVLVRYRLHSEQNSQREKTQSASEVRRIRAAQLHR